MGGGRGGGGGGGVPCSEAVPGGGGGARELLEEASRSVRGGIAGGVPEYPRVQLVELVVLDCRERVGLRTTVLEFVEFVEEFTTTPPPPPPPAPAPQEGTKSALRI